MPSFARVVGALDRFGGERTHERAQARPPELGVSRPEDHTAGELREDQRRVDESVGVPGNDDAAAFCGDVLQSADVHLAEEDPHQGVDRASQRRVHRHRLDATAESE